MSKALIVIDYTVDFVADEGKLTAGAPAQAIEAALVKTVRASYEQGDYIFMAVDAHEAGDKFHPESRLFPEHNIKGSSGRNLYGQLAGLYEEIKEDSRVFWMDKRYYSAFAGTELDSRLRERGVKTVVLSGVLTDICVLHTAISAYNLGYEIEIVDAAVATMSEDSRQWALNHFEQVLGAKII